VVGCEVISVLEKLGASAPELLVAKEISGTQAEAVSGE
jgi:hypothetical protein